MKTYHTLFFSFLLVIFSIHSFAQNKSDVTALIDRGVALNDSGKYNEAIGKYQAALKIDPKNLKAQYELSFTLSSSGRSKEAIPYLEKVAASNTYAAAYDLLGSIYDDDKDYEKAVAYYKLGIIAFPDYQRLRFNLAISYLRQKKYPEAEEAAIKAIELDPKHASSQRAYALATYGENKLGCSLLGWCSFLLLEPQTQRSAGAYSYIKYILNNGIKKTGEKAVTISISSSDMSPSKLALSLAIVNSTDDKKNLSATDSLELQLKSVFEVSHIIADDKEPQFFSKYLADYFEKLAKSGNMPAFTRYITLSIFKDEDTAWFKDHPKELTDLDKWISSTERNF
ncbi:MAG: tetratricopeptide repeat protein [Mucilaginibacter sp.]